MKIKSILIALAFVFYCGIQATSAQSQTNDNEKIDAFIEKKRAYNKRNGFGYRIQLYNGSENRAKSIRGRFEIEFPTLKTYLNYTAPEWKIQVGNFKTTLMADKTLLEISEKFSGAIVIPIRN
jgi:hypothetical protein